MTLSQLRRQYESTGLYEAQMQPDPIAQLERWLNEALSQEVQDATAMVVSTVSERGEPSSRVVLLKKLDVDGLTFFTRYSSRKGLDIAMNSAVCLLFHWREFDRQVRVQGAAERTTLEESQVYFKTRPHLSQIAARVACQISGATSRAELERLFQDEAERFPDEVPLPEGWGGYRVVPREFEFWQGRENRLHDRIVYSVSGAGSWQMSRLPP